LGVRFMIGLIVVVALLVVVSIHLYESSRSSIHESTTSSPPKNTHPVESTSNTYTPPPSCGGSPSPSETTGIQLKEGVVVSRYCPVYDTMVEFRVYANVITDQELSGKVTLELEDYVKRAGEINMTIPRETLELLEALRSRSGGVALLEVIVEIRNKGGSSINIYGGTPCGHILDYIVKNITSASSREAIGFSRVEIKPVNGSVYTGEPLICTLALYRQILNPGGSMQNIYYYLIEKPTIGGEFKARLDATVIGFTDTLCYNPSPRDPCNCSLSLEITY
jgi:hypothetical protein